MLDELDELLDDELLDEFELLFDDELLDELLFEFEFELLFEFDPPRRPRRCSGRTRNVEGFDRLEIYLRNLHGPPGFGPRPRRRDLQT